MIFPTLCNEFIWMAWKRCNQLRIVFKYWYRVWRIIFVYFCLWTESVLDKAALIYDRKQWPSPNSEYFRNCTIRGCFVTYHCLNGGIAWMTVKAPLEAIALDVHKLLKKKDIGDSSTRLAISPINNSNQNIRQLYWSRVRANFPIQYRFLMQQRY